MHDSWDEDSRKIFMSIWLAIEGLQGQRDKAKKKISGVQLVMLAKVPASTCSIIAYAITLSVSSHEQACGRLSSLGHSVLLDLESVSGVTRCGTLLVSLSSPYTLCAAGKAGVDVHLLEEISELSFSWLNSGKGRSRFLHAKLSIPSSRNFAVIVCPLIVARRNCLTHMHFAHFNAVIFIKH